MKGCFFLNIKYINCQGHTDDSFHKERLSENRRSCNYRWLGTSESKHRLTGSGIKTLLLSARFKVIL